MQALGFLFLLGGPCSRQDPISFKKIDNSFFTGGRQANTEGHLGCSEGFNFNLYKESIGFKPNSSGREQTHAAMESSAKNLIQMNYRNFMTSMKVFFALTNLKRKKNKE